MSDGVGDCFQAIQPGTTGGCPPGTTLMSGWCADQSESSLPLTQAQSALVSGAIACPAGYVQSGPNCFNPNNTANSFTVGTAPDYTWLYVAGAALAALMLMGR